MKSVGDTEREEALRDCDGATVVKALPVMARAQKRARINLIGNIVNISMYQKWKIGRSRCDCWEMKNYENK